MLSRDAPPEPGAPSREGVAAEVLRVARGRIAAFSNLPRADREDAVQQTVTRVLEAVEAGSVSNVPAFTRRVAFHCAVDAVRRRGKDDAWTVVSSERGGSNSESPEALTREKRRMDALSAVTGDLRSLVENAPENYRRVVEQHYWKGRSLEDNVRAAWGATRRRDLKTPQ